MSESKKPTAPKRVAPDCTECVYYDYDELFEEYYCRADLDQDEVERLGASKRAVCPCFRPYDEYKSVRKQN